MSNKKLPSIGQRMFGGTVFEACYCDDEGSWLAKILLDQGGMRVISDKTLPEAMLPIKFDEVAKPLIKWINDNANPHAIIVIDGTSAVLYYGEKSVLTDEFIKD